MRSLPTRAAAGLALLIATALVSSCANRATVPPLIQVPPDPSSIGSLPDLDRHTPFYGRVRLMDGREYEGTVLSVGECVQFKSAFRTEPRYITFAADDVMRVEEAYRGSVADHALWAAISGLGGMVMGWMAKGATNLDNALFDEDDDVDHEGIRRWGRIGFLYGVATAPLSFFSTWGDSRIVFDRIGGGKTESRLPSIDWDGWREESGR